MTIKSDKWIRRQCHNTAFPMIEPFLTSNVNTLPSGKKMPSAGLSSYGYDIRLGRNFKFFGETLVMTGSDATRIGGPLVKNYLTPDSYVVEKDGAACGFNSPIYENKVIDVCDFDESLVTEIDDVDNITIPPGGFVLGVSMERIRVPRNVSVVCMGKSTIARAGVIVIVTPLEAGWEGYVTLEITNVTKMPVKLHAGIGITQLQFFESDEECDVSYADRNGKYQNQPNKAIPPVL